MRSICLVLLLAASSALGQSYEPCTNTLDQTNTFHTIMCTYPLTASQILGAFSQSPFNENIRQLTIRNISDMTDSVMEQIMNRLATSQDTLLRLFLETNNLSEIPFGVKQLLALDVLSMADNNVNSLKPGDLAFKAKLTFLGLQNNKLTDLPAGLFDDSDFSSANIGLQGNGLYRLSESVFKNVFRSMDDEIENTNGYFDFAGNPISCDCSLAWLVRDNRDLLSFANGAVCASGQNIADLPAAIFSNC